MFSGQGSQNYQMAKDLYDVHEGFRGHMNKLDDLIKAQLGESVLAHMYDKKNHVTDSFDRLLYTHPAIFMVQVALARVLMDSKLKPDLVMGTSLGELVAAHISNAISIEDAIHIVLMQAKSIEKYCREAGMLAILASEFSYSEIPVIYEHSELASINAKGFFVVSGTDASLEKIQLYLKKNDVAFLRLPVKYGFHSSMMDSSKEAIEQVLKNVTWYKPTIPFVSCTAVGERTSLDKDYFWQVLREPIRLSETIQSLALDNAYNYVDVGASGIMATAVKNNLNANSSSKVYSILSPFGGNISRLQRTQSSLKQDQGNHKKELNMNAFVFPGQGSQKKGMGAELFDLFPDYEAVADTVLGYSIRELCLDDPRRELNKTQFTQPALFVVNALSYLKKIKESNTKPNFILGHSLGEFNALFSAGVFDFETGLKLVKKRGQLMSQAKDGSMAAVIGYDAEKVVSLLKNNGLLTIDVANFNSPIQTVLSGKKSDILGAASIFEKAGATYFPLNVSAAFHSRYMKSAMAEFGRYLAEFDFNQPEVPVISNVSARPYTHELIKDNLQKQIVSSVRWTDSIRYIISEGCEEIEELGPGDVLKKLFAAIKKDAPKKVYKPDNPSEQTVVQKELDVNVINNISTNHITANGHDESSAKKVITADIETKSKRAKSTKSAKSTKPAKLSLSASALGSERFKQDYNLRYAYVSGSMYKGISSKELVVKMATSGYLAFLGTGGVKLAAIEEQLSYIKSKLTKGESFGANLLVNLKDPESEMTLVKSLLHFGVKFVEASAYMQVSPALVYYRLQSLQRDSDGVVRSTNKLIAKISRPEVATIFLTPAPERIVNRLFESGLVTENQVEMAKEVSMADDLCVEADSGGHTDMGVMGTLLPTIIRLRDEICLKQHYKQDIRVGAAGGIGTPESAASVFVLGADFIVTGSINQCTIEAGTSDQVKDLLQQVNVQDTAYAPAGDMFELGAKVQVLKKGLFFPARANKLYDIWRHFDSIDAIDSKTRQQLEEKYFKKTLDAVWAETVEYYKKVAPSEVEKAQNKPKQKMALIFRWYFVNSTRAAMDGDESQRVDYQVHCGPALGAFNQWVKGTELESWKRRHVNQIADKLMSATADFMNSRLALYMD
jgi:trans-AT polyketide synthase/acyltransferase/oxidoreductase domain-containing protein